MLRSVDTVQDGALRVTPLPIAVRRPQEWEDLAVCKGSDASLFFGPNRFEPKRERDTREAAAKAICATCPVITPCRDAAIARAETFGVWGGLGEVERRAIVARRAERAV